MQLSKDRNLGEREKLQLQISDMSHEMQQQQETIQVIFSICSVINSVNEINYL